MKEIALYDAKNGLSALVTEVERTGDNVIITRHGKPVACLSAVGAGDRSEQRAAVARLLIERLESGKSVPGEGPSWQDLKEEMDAERP